MTINHFQSLPDEALLPILQWLGIKDLLIVAQLDRRFHSIVNEAALWRNRIPSIATKGAAYPAALHARFSQVLAGKTQPCLSTLYLNCRPKQIEIIENEERQPVLLHTFRGFLGAERGVRTMNLGTQKEATYWCGYGRMREIEKMWHLPFDQPLVAIQIPPGAGDGIISTIRFLDRGLQFESSLQISSPIIEQLVPFQTKSGARGVIVDNSLEYAFYVEEKVAGAQIWTRKHVIRARYSHLQVVRQDKGFTLVASNENGAFTVCLDEDDQPWNNLGARLLPVRNFPRGIGRPGIVKLGETQYLYANDTLTNLFIIFPLDGDLTRPSWALPWRANHVSGRAERVTAMSLGENWLLVTHSRTPDGLSSTHRWILRADCSHELASVDALDHPYDSPLFYEAGTTAGPRPLGTWPVEGGLSTFTENNGQITRAEWIKDLGDLRYRTYSVAALKTAVVASTLVMLVLFAHGMAKNDPGQSLALAAGSPVFALVVGYAGHAAEEKFLPGRIKRLPTLLILWAIYKTLGLKEPWAEKSFAVYGLASFVGSMHSLRFARELTLWRRYKMHPPPQPQASSAT